jgi:hypothetical protein
MAEQKISNQQIQSTTITGDKIVANTIGSSNLTTTGISAGTYGGEEQIPVITVDSQGRLSTAANVSVSAPLPNILMLSGM